MNDNELPTHHLLEKNQHFIIKQIRKSHRLIMTEFILNAAVTFSVTCLMIVVSIINDQFKRILPFVFYPIFLVTLFAINYSKYRRYFKKINAQFNLITDIKVDNDEAQIMNTKLVYGITTYINSICELYAFVTKGKKNSEETMKNEDRAKELKKLFKIRVILDLLFITLFSISLVIVIYFTKIGEITIPWLYIAFIVIIVVLIIMAIIGFHARATIRNWMSIYQILDIWGTMIESDQRLEDFEELAIG